MNLSFKYSNIKFDDIKKYEPQIKQIVDNFNSKYNDLPNKNNTNKKICKTLCGKIKKNFKIALFILKKI